MTQRSLLREAGAEGKRRGGNDVSPSLMERDLERREMICFEANLRAAS